MTTNQGQDATALSMAQPDRKDEKPLLVFAAMPAAGHVSPPMQLARELINKGYDVVFMSSPEFKSGIEKIGAEWYECSPCFTAGFLVEREKYPPGMPRFLYDVEKVFIDAMASRSACMRSLLEMLHGRNPDRRIIIVNEMCSQAVLPFQFGAPLPKGYSKFPPTIGLNVTPVGVRSDDTAPFGIALPPDASESGRVRNRMLYDMMYDGPFKGISDHSRKRLGELGCTSLPEGMVLDSWVTEYDTMFQLSSPSMDYPRSDLPLSIRFAGTLPRRPIDPKYQYPSWWGELTANAALSAGSKNRKKIVPVAQGTVAMDYDELVIPTIKALSGRDDVIVVAILCARGATLPPDVPVPANARIVDYLPYDAVLPLADVFVTNGGFGSFVHAAVNGVPMVIGGETEDKPEVAMRAEYAGMGVNLRTATPSSEAVSAAVAKVLGEPRYKHRALRIKQDNADLDAVHMIEKQILAYAGED